MPPESACTPPVSGTTEVCFVPRLYARTPLSLRMRANVLLEVTMSCLGVKLVPKLALLRELVMSGGQTPKAEGELGVTSISSMLEELPLASTMELALGTPAMWVGNPGASTGPVVKRVSLQLAT